MIMSCIKPKLKQQCYTNNLEILKENSHFYQFGEKGIGLEPQDPFHSCMIDNSIQKYFFKLSSYDGI